MARILVVEDDENLRDYFRFVLENSGHRVEGVGDGQAALQMCLSAPPDLVLLDVMIPEVNGYEVCNRLKADEKTKGVKIIMVTAKGFSADRQQAKNAGADGFLPKPVSPLELMGEVNKLLTPPAV
jgi:CheY-like chemotaxis protein